jgi:hypothetical protein
MRKLWLGLFLFLGIAPAQAQSTFTMPPPAGVALMGLQAVTACGGALLSNGNTAFAVMDLTGRLCVASSVSQGTSPWVVANQGGATTPAKVTIAVTNTYQQALAPAASRKGCTLQYIAVAGTKGFVFFGSAPGDTTTSFQLVNGQSISCSVPGLVLTDAVQVTATATDIFVVTNQ